MIDLKKYELDLNPRPALKRKRRNCRSCKKRYDTDMSYAAGVCSKVCHDRRMEFLIKRKMARRREKASRAMDGFYTSREWLGLRWKILRKYGFKCMACKATDKQIHVDHIKPTSKFPELRLDPNNLQVLCVECNLGKGNRTYDDLR